MLSTMHTDAISETQKPEIIEKYNQIKTYVDISDQMYAYTSFVRKTTKWYLRLFFHLITQTALVNAWRLYCSAKRKKLKNKNEEDQNIKNKTQNSRTK